MMMQQIQTTWRDVLRTGIGIIVADDTVEGMPFTTFEMQGWTEQTQYEGKNLLSNIPTMWNIGVGLTWSAVSGTSVEYNTNAKYGAVFIIDDIKANTKYSFKNIRTDKVWVNRIIEGDEGGLGYANHRLYDNVSTQNKEEYSFTTSSENVTRLYISVRTLPELDTGNAAGADISENDIRNMQICLSEGDPLYEPYVGGQPSPSPEYPQEIFHAGTWNEETQKYEVDVKLRGSNLLNKDGENVSGLYMGFPICNDGNTVTLTLYEKDSSVDVSGVYIGLSNRGLDHVDGVIWALEGGELKNRSITSAVGFISIYPKTAVEKAFNRYDIMVNFGKVSMPYQDYSEQTLTLTSDRPLAKWDRLVKQNGQWGWEYRSREILCDGSDDDPWALYADRRGFVKSGIYIDMKQGVRADGWCNILPNQKLAQETEGVIFGLNNKNIYVCYVSEYATTVEEWKAWLSNNNMILVFEVETPEFVSLTETEQQALESLRTYYPTTVVSNEQEMFMQIEYKTNIPEEVTS